MALAKRLPTVCSLAATLLFASLTPAPAQDRPARVDQPTHDLQIILLRASSGTESVPELPEDAVRALRDAARILPYQHFERIDAAWLRTDRRARTRLGEAGAFEVSLGIGAATSDPERILVDYLELTYHSFVRDEETGEPVWVGDTRNLLASSFGARIGETVVVGTSRADGPDEALIVLFKAAR